jgi:undecaprenyl-diphosphatase
MSDSTKSNSGSNTLKNRNDTESRAFLDPTRGGSADRLVTTIARGHEIVATAIALIFSFAIMGLAMVALGLLITHVLAHGSIGVWDHHVSLWFDRHRSAHWNRITGDFTDIADKFEIAGVAAVLTIVLLFRRWGRHAFLLLAGLAIELSVFLAANAIVARPRPAVSHLGGTPSTYSFPSGHTAATFALYGGIALIVAVATSRWWARFLMWTFAFVLTAAVGLSRVYRGEHYPSDVIAGLLLGVGSLMAAVFIIRVIGVSRAVHAKPVQHSTFATADSRLDDAGQ